MLTAIQTPTIRPFQASDAVLIVNRDGTQCAKGMLQQQARCGPAFTACIEDQPMACAGVVLLWPGVGIAWMVMSDDLHGQGVWLTRTVKAFLCDIVRRHRLHRVEAVALIDSPRNQRWLELLGFTHEEHGIAQHYLHDRRSVIRYERIER